MNPTRPASNRRLAVPLLCAWALALVWTTGTRAGAIYDPSGGQLPAAQGWAFLALPPGAASQTVAGGVYTLNTGGGTGIVDGGSNGISGGLFRADQGLDTAGGYEIGLRMRLGFESHANANRGGFSLLAIGSDFRRSVEIAFWEDSIWAYDLSGTSFVQGALGAIGLDTTNAFHDYLLRVASARFDFFMDGALLFGGNLVDYSPANVTVLGQKIYEQNNLLFFGDDTGSARAAVQIQRIDFAQIPEPPTLACLALGLAGLTLGRRGRPRVADGPAEPPHPG